MSERTGVNAVELAALQALDDLGLSPDHPYKKSAHVVEHLYHAHGIPPEYGYDTLCRLQAEWVVHIRLVDLHGNGGGPSDRAAAPRYTEVRLSPAGVLALASERGDAPKLPIGLINGDFRWHGTAPAFDPRRVVAAVLRAAEDPAVSDSDLVALAGPPAFVTGCELSGDFAGLARGRNVEVRMRARLTVEDDGRDVSFVISHPPPETSIERIAESIASRRMRPALPGYPRLARQMGIPLRDLRNESMWPVDRLICVPDRDADLSKVKRQILQTSPVTIKRPMQLAAPLAVLIRAIADDPEPQRRALDALLDGR
jgi:DNA gyrase subunit A